MQKKRILIFLLPLFIISPQLRSEEVDCKGLKVSWVRPLVAKLFSYAHLQNKKKLYVKTFVGQKEFCHLFQGKTQLKRIGVSSTTWLPMIKSLEGLDKVKGISGKRFSQSISPRQRSEIKELGHPLSVEKLKSLNLDFVGVSTFSEFERIKRKNIKSVMIIPSHQELHPLGRAEWIKFWALISGEREKGERIFRDVYARYQSLKSRKLNGPIVALGPIWGGSWMAPGGEGHMATLIKDAGGRYAFPFLAGGHTHRLSLEKAFGPLKSADIWLPHSLHRSFTKLQEMSPRFLTFKNLKHLKIFNNTKKLNASQGNDFWETAIARPDLLLSDLKKIISTKSSGLIWYEELGLK